MIILVENDKFIRRAQIASLAMTVLLFLLPIIFWGKLSEEVPLFYSLPWGEGQIANKPLLFILGGISFLFITINLLLAKILENEIFLRRVLWAGCVSSIILALITLLRIILLF
ncbi:hypothetical protein HYZ78_01625 [Candidatus Microgenomates bacterium]|nr:hypothetical protein [Candidatus Microgenomates bacterium]